MSVLDTLIDRFTQQDELLRQILRVLKSINSVMGGEPKVGLVGIDDVYWSTPTPISVSADENPTYLFDPLGKTSLTPFTPTYMRVTSSSEIDVRINSSTNPKITIPAGGSAEIGEYRPFKVVKLFVYNTVDTTITILTTGRSGI